MDLVIKIPKDDFEKIKNISFVENTETMLHQSSEDRKGTMMLFRVMDAIKDGTPLPKGHGNLIDREDLIENGISKGFCDWYDEIKMADTIIEADEEVQDADSD